MKQGKNKEKKEKTKTKPEKAIENQKNAAESSIQSIKGKKRFAWLTCK